jgi:single-strand DNA-binding protein
MLNVAVLMGRLTTDPELRHTPNGVPVARFSIAQDRSYLKGGSEKITDFFNIVAWRSTAEFVSKYFHKGQLIAVKGTIETGSYKDREGITRKTFDIVADNVYFGEPKRSDDTSQQQSNMQDSDREISSQPASYSSGNNEDFQEIPMDDDLPF